jgi:hypothetical protein
MKVLAAILVLAASAASACPAHRSVSQRALFTSANVCPSLGVIASSCPGFVVDHLIPLCAGGPDTAKNMQWQTIAESKQKDKVERAQCAALRRPK